MRSYNGWHGWPSFIFNANKSPKYALMWTDVGYIFCRQDAFSWNSMSYAKQCINEQTRLFCFTWAIADCLIGTVLEHSTQKRHKQKWSKPLISGCNFARCPDEWPSSNVQLEARHRFDLSTIFTYNEHFVAVTIYKHAHFYSKYLRLFYFDKRSYFVERAKRVVQSSK